jgi:signal transduction histidine kinase
MNNARDSLSSRTEKKIVIEANNYLNNQIYISIADTGIGIDREASKKIFFPFFSTKVSGLGIGLSLSENIIEQHQGKIEVDSIKDKGTIFKIWLPIK